MIKLDLNAVQRKVKRGLKQLKRGAAEVAQEIKQRVETAVEGRNDYPPKVRDILTKYGDQTIQSISINRTPVPAVLTGALSLFSLGKFGKRLKRNFDELFHLYIDITLTSGTRLSIEKNEVINMDVNYRKPLRTETKQVTDIPAELTINQMLDKTKSYMGNKYFMYSPSSNNCQDFIVSIFRANNIGNEQDIQFIKQDTEQLFNRLPYLKKLATSVTDLGAAANVLVTGKGLNKTDKYVIQSVTFDKDKWKTNNAKKWLKENDYKVVKVDKTRTLLRFRQEDPDEVVEKGFTEYRTKSLGESGINLIIGYKKNKISSKNIMPRVKKTVVIAEPEMVMCPMCKAKMEGGRVDVGKAFKKLGRSIKKGIEKEIIKPSEKALVPVALGTADYVTKKKGGLATDVIKYGIPAASAALLGAAATAASQGNPVAGVAGSALGSKLGSMGAAELQKATGTGMRKGRFAKGSPEAMAWAAKMREARIAKKMQ